MTITEQMLFEFRFIDVVLGVVGAFRESLLILECHAPDSQAKVKPECGRAVAFSAGLENLHGVAGILQGRRCALALWFTLRQKHDEQQRKVAWETLQKAKELKRLEKLPLFTPEVATHVEL